MERGRPNLKSLMLPYYVWALGMGFCCLEILHGESYGESICGIAEAEVNVGGNTITEGKENL